MSIVIVHDGPKEHALALTSVIAPLRRKYNQENIRVVTSTQNAVFYRFLSGVTVQRLSDPSPVTCDVLVDFGGSDAAISISSSVVANRYYGLLPSEGSEVDSHAFRGVYSGHEVKRNIFQMLYGIAGLKWRGEGYNFQYFPRAKQRDNRVGVAVRDTTVRTFIKDNLHVSDERIWHVPIKENVLRQFDEVNKCDSVVTDDPFVMHVAVALRKHVDFLLYEPPTMRHEFFGRGCAHFVPDSIKGS